MRSRLHAAAGHPWAPIALAVVLTGCMALLAGRFWIPLDDGTLAQSAERVLHGQLPHRDFGDPYTGLNAMVGALAFQLFGLRLSSLRLPLVVGFAAWLPAVWLLASRLVPPAGALAAMALAALLSVPTYPAAMPTWFVLFLVTWGSWCLLRGMEEGRRGWLAAAGGAAGVAILFKVVGLYFLAAALLSVAWRRADGSRSYAAVVAFKGAVLVVLLSLLVLPRGGFTSVYHFLAPAVALVAALVLRASRAREGAPRSDGALPALIADASALLLGALLPVGLFLLPYASAGALEPWLEGVFLLPARRFASAASPPGAPWTLLPGAAAVGLAVVASRLEPRREFVLSLVTAALLAAALAFDDATGGAVTAGLWYGLRGWIPALALVGAAALASRPRRDHAAPFALLATVALWSWVQFPYAAPAYFFYVAPLGVLATAALVSTGLLRAGPVLLLLTGLAGYLGAGYVVGTAAAAPARLEVERGGIRVSPLDAAVYEGVVAQVRRHVGGGGLWAGPDAPEVYFLAGSPNPTPTLYEFLAPAPPTPQGLAELVAAHDVRVAVLNTRPLFSRPLDPATVEYLVNTFPHAEAVGPFVVRWRQPR